LLADSYLEKGLRDLDKTSWSYGCMKIATLLFLSIYSLCLCCMLCWNFVCWLTFLIFIFLISASTKREHSLEIKVNEKIHNAPTSHDSAGSELGWPSLGDLAALEWQHIKYLGVTAYHGGLHAHNRHIGKLSTCMEANGLLIALTEYIMLCMDLLGGRPPQNKSLKNQLSIEFDTISSVKLKLLTALLEHINLKSMGSLARWDSASNCTPPPCWHPY